jgi:hypothetical protein
MWLWMMKLYLTDADEPVMEQATVQELTSQALFATDKKSNISLLYLFRKATEEL